MFHYLDPIGLISVLLAVALLKLEITVYFLCLSLPVKSLTRIKHVKLFSFTDNRLLNVFAAL